MRWITFAASGLGAIGLFAGTAAAVPTVVLEPLPWAGSGADEVDVYLNGCDASPYCYNLEFQIPGVSPIEVHRDGVDFEAVLVSRVVGERWEYGLEDIEFSAAPEVLGFGISVTVFGLIEVPFDGIHPTSAIAFDFEPGDQYESSMGIDWVTAFVASDTVKQAGFITWGVNMTQEGWATNSSCGFAIPGIALDDCLQSLEIFSPTVVDGLRHPGVAEPGSALLVAAGAALGVGARRRRC